MERDKQDYVNREDATVNRRDMLTPKSLLKTRVVIALWEIKILSTLTICKVMLMRQINDMWIQTTFHQQYHTVNLFDNILPAFSILQIILIFL